MYFDIPKHLSPCQQTLLAYLGGAPYRKNVFDAENVIYRDLGTHDIEISGGHTKYQPFCIYVWQKDPPRILERYGNLAHDHENIKHILDDIVRRYSKEEE